MMFIGKLLTETLMMETTVRNKLNYNTNNKVDHLNNRNEQKLIFRIIYL